MAERGLLYVIGFEFDIEHPTQVVLDYMQHNYNNLLPETARVSPETWLEQCQQQAGAAYDLMNQLSTVAWNLCLVRQDHPCVRFLFSWLSRVCRAAAKRRPKY